MTVAFDQFSSTGSTVGASNSWTHTPVSTSDIRGVICTIGSRPGTTDAVTAVTYGGVAMSHVALSPEPITAGNEDGIISGYFLGTSSIPQGAQTVAVTISTASTAMWRAGVTTLTAAANLEVENTAVLDQVVANPSVTVVTTPDLNCFIHGFLYSGQNTTVTVSTNYTSDHLFIFSAQVGSWMHRTANSTGGNVTVNWTAASEDAGIIAIAVNEMATSTGAAQSIIPILMYQYRVRGQ